MQYSGNILEIRSKSAPINPELYDYHEFIYQFGNSNNKMKAFHEYIITDTMGMIGSVGGTLGIFIGFSMTGVISSIIEFFKERKIGRNIVV